MKKRCTLLFLISMLFMSLPQRPLYAMQANSGENQSTISVRLFLLLITSLIVQEASGSQETCFPTEPRDKYFFWNCPMSNYLLSATNVAEAKLLNQLCQSGESATFKPSSVSECTQKIAERNAELLRNDAAERHRLKNFPLLNHFCPVIPKETVLKLFKQLPPYLKWRLEDCLSRATNDGQKENCEYNYVSRSTGIIETQLREQIPQLAAEKLEAILNSCPEDIANAIMHTLQQYTEFDHTIAQQCKSQRALRDLEKRCQALEIQCKKDQQVHTHCNSRSQKSSVYAINQPDRRR